MELFFFKFSIIFAIILQSFSITGLEVMGHFFSGKIDPNIQFIDYHAACFARGHFSDYFNTRIDKWDKIIDNLKSKYPQEQVAERYFINAAQPRADGVNVIREKDPGLCMTSQFIVAKKEIEWIWANCTERLPYICSLTKQFRNQNPNEELRALVDHIPTAIQNVFDGVRDFADWIKKKLVATKEFSVNELQEVLVVVKDSVATVGQHASDALDTVRKNSDKIAKNLQERLKFNKERAEKALKWVEDEIANSVYDVKETLSLIGKSLLSTAEFSAEQIEKSLEIVTNMIKETGKGIGRTAENAWQWIKTNFNTLNANLSEQLGVKREKVEKILRKTLRKLHEAFEKSEDEKDSDED